MAPSRENMDTESLIVAEDAPSSQITAVPSSPPCGPASSGGRSDRPRKPPSITPRTFRRFFTPRSVMRTRQIMSSARRAFQDITLPANNRSRMRGHGDGNVLEPFADINVLRDENGSTTVQGKRRKTLHYPEPTFDRGYQLHEDISSPTSALGDGRHKCPEPLTPESMRFLDNTALDEPEVLRPKAIQRVQRRWQASSVSARLLHRDLGVITDSRKRFHAANWHHETVHFWSGPADIYQCRDQYSVPLIPFCVASCNSNSLVAIGDEAGSVRLLDPANDAKHSFGASYLNFQVHSNAILDMAFSSDDLLLGTASGDQTAHIVDMPTQQSIHVLAGHIASMKQIRFQPGQGSNKVIATSSRDGTIHIWDLRCKGNESAIVLGGGSGNESRIINHAHPVKSIFEAHNDRCFPKKTNLTKSTRLASNNTLPTPPSSQRDISITSLTFLPTGREHLLLSASEANSSIKLWDLRNTRTNRRATHNNHNNTPLTTMPQPPSHSGDRRSYGITTLALNHEGSRLYSLCRDNTIYVYSSAHVILGHAPELSSQNSRTYSSRRSPSVPKPSLGPLYGLRHPDLRSTSFYVKLSLRKPQGDKTELLAVGGGGQGGPVLFPTDERYFHRHHTPASRQRGFGNVDEDGGDIPIYTHATPLVRGHLVEREVTSTAWSADGDLVSLGDDYIVRCWREDAEQARRLRLAKEGEGERGGCGWAEFDESEDENEDDDGEDGG